MLVPEFCHRERKRQARREAILCAAHDLFVEKGYEATTLSDVVRRSGGSLATLYELFENKPGLLRALVTERCQRISETIDRVASSDQSAREGLRDIAEHMFGKIVDPDAAALFKAAMTQPELGPQLYQAGPAMGQAKVAQYLEVHARRGALMLDDAERAAQLFFQMMFGHFHQRLIFGMPLQIGAEEKSAHIERILDAFFSIYGPHPQCARCQAAVEHSSKIQG